MNLDVKSVRLSTTNDELRQLSAQELSVFRKFLKILELAQKEKKISLLYRGEKKKSLTNKLNKTYGKHIFFEYLFYVGEKAKCYFVPPADMPAKQKLPISISDISDHIFEFIFEELHRVLTQEALGTPGRKAALKNFKDENPSFAQFFAQAENKNVFLEKIKHSDDKIQVRDYYLHLLHTDQLGNIPFFVSTSTKRSQAKTFATLMKGKKRTKEAVIFYYFLPNDSNTQYAVSYLSSQQGESLCNNLGLPIYSENFYPSQKEFSVKGALFPHFMLGVFDLESQLFIANPHIFKAQNCRPHSALESVLEHGLTIDQSSNFSKFIESTSYLGYVTRWNKSETYSDTVF